MPANRLEQKSATLCSQQKIVLPSKWRQSIALWRWPHRGACTGLHTKSVAEGMSWSFPVPCCYSWAALSPTWWLRLFYYPQTAAACGAKVVFLPLGGIFVNENTADCCCPWLLPLFLLTCQEKTIFCPFLAHHTVYTTFFKGPWHRQLREYCSIEKRTKRKHCV